MSWRGLVGPDTLDWLLEDDVPAVRAFALGHLLDRAGDAPELVAARGAAMRCDPIRSILDAQEPDGHWGPPGPGYYPKYTGTVWQLMFLDQLGADAADERVQRACDYVLEHTPTSVGGMGAVASRPDQPPLPSAAIHCLNGNVVRALVGFGRLDDPRVQAAVEWAARAVTGEGMERYYRSGTSGPCFECAANDRHPCAWGAIKELRAFAAIPKRRRTPLVRRAIEAGVDLLLSVDPATAAYPTADRDSKPSGAWFQLGFPSAYVTDVLQNLEVLTELGRGRDPRLANAVAWLVDQRDADGRWHNRHAYNGKTTVPFERQGAPSKWVTARACAVLRAVPAPGGTR